MSAVHNRSGQPSKAMPTSLSHFGNHKVSLLGKASSGIGRSTPDSEALASDDDEGEHHRLSAAASNASHPQKPTRRISWLNEIPSNSTRKPSTQLSATYSPNNSLPPTPSGDLTSWPPPSASPKMNASSNWGPAGGSSFPWTSTAIWNENRKEPPARLQEVLSSTSPTATGVNLINNDFQSPLRNKGPVNDAGIPFQIPLHPTPKTYRSQSYSVGQLDPDTLNAPTVRPNTNAGRGRGGPQVSNLQHRSSRPSVLGDLGHDPGPLGRVREVDDDDENEQDSNSSQTHSSAQARTIEQLTRENARLRQAATSQYDNRYRDRTGSTISTGSGFSGTAAPLQNSRHRGGPYPDGSDLAVDDHEDHNASFQEFPSQNVLRRLSEQLTHNQEALQYSAAQNLESAKRAQWQTSLGFGSVPEMPQSRRHSFADVPTRQGSISSNGRGPFEDSSVLLPTNPADRDEGYGTYGEDSQETQVEYPPYFAGPSLHRVPPGGSSLHQAYVSPNTYGRTHHNDHHSQPLYIVTFKCCRSDVFYVQEGTGLQVKPGDLVIVEADRGTDLGTVAHADIGWEQGRQMKEHYAEEHYKWLMLFSRQSENGGPNAVNPNGLGPNGAPGSAVGGMGPPGAHGAQDLQPGELKPKLIRRLAQSHEVQSLRDKEGNEAKAKRVCQQKVLEHRLNMEILDAEFQMDWKKLTFYYFADAYINFNSLVTDLFKIYKTRIWMSAINPASFVTPTSSLSVPPPFTAMGGPGGRISPANRRRPQAAGPAPTSAGGYSEHAETPRRTNIPQASGVRNAYFNPYQNPGLANGLHQQQAHEIAGYAPLSYGHPGNAGPFSPYAGHHYAAMLDPNAPSFSTSQHSTSSPDRGDRSPGPEWTGNFQSLALGGT